MHDLDTSPEDDTTAHVECFQILANEVRYEILRELSVASDPVPFTTLQERIDVADSGNFNYHLSQLIDQFIEKTSRGYVLRSSGQSVIDAVRMSSLTHEVEIQPRRIDATCPLCGAPQRCGYRGSMLELWCTACSGMSGPQHGDGRLVSLAFPASGLVGRGLQEAVEVALRWFNAQIIALLDGFCPDCMGPVQMEIELCESHTTERDGICPSCQHRSRGWLIHTCATCHNGRSYPIWHTALFSPDVLDWLHPRIHPFERAPLVPFFLGTNGTRRYVSEEVVEEDPLTLQATVHLDDDKRSLLIDASPSGHSVTLSTELARGTAD